MALAYSIQTKSSKMVFNVFEKGENLLQKSPGIALESENLFRFIGGWLNPPLRPLGYLRSKKPG